MEIERVLRVIHRISHMPVKENLHFSGDVPPIYRASQDNCVRSFDFVKNGFKIILLMAFHLRVAAPAGEAVLEIKVMEIYLFCLMAAIPGSLQDLAAHPANISVFSVRADNGKNVHSSSLTFFYLFSDNIQKAGC